MEFAKGGLIESIKDALGPKATSTIHARASPVLQYIQFCKDRGIEPFPLVEHTCYDYVKSCEGRAATYTRSFLLSLSFANYHFGVQGADVVLGSSRIRGLVNTLFAQKRKLVQRPPLTVNQIRLRFSDGQQICQLTLDQQDDGFGFVEALAAKTKTSVSLDRKTRHLPVAVPLLAFGDAQWLPTWLDLRQKELGAQANSIDEFIPLLPSPTMKGWSKMPLGVTSGANWLRSLLQGVEPEKGTPVGTHSLKATLLSMSAKYGMNHGVRKLLGYHAGSKNQSMLCYSRDAMAEPLRQMCQMIQEVKAGRFLPDCSRSGRFPAVAESEIPKEQDELSESSSSGSENEEEVDHVQEEAACASVVGTWRPSKDERLETAIFVRHKVSRCIHAFADESGIEFTCGRKMANTYEVLRTFVAMSYGDSKAVFAQRCKEIGLDDAVTSKIISHGLDTMSKFAFASNFQPGATDETPLVNLTKDFLSRSPTTVEMSCIRRLFSESYANVASDIKSRVEASDDTPARRLAPAERAERLKQQQRRLIGVNISGPYEPGDALVDRCISVYESDRIQYIPWDVCTSREHEILHGSKKDQSLTFDTSGALKLQRQTKVEPCSTASEIQVRYCLTRRALALEQANVVGFAKMEAWSEKMMQTRLEDPPPNHVRTTMKQLEMADRKLFVLISERTREGIKPSPAGRPVDAVIKDCMESSEVLTLLQPRPSSSSSRPAETPSSGEPPSKRFKGSGKGNKGKGSGKLGKDSFIRIPHELLALNAVPATPKGHRLCFSYNLKTCSNTVDKQRCPKGLHACAVKGCHKQHPALDCPGAGKE
ncbi:unnamed protein product [Durusdinium trenchii]|uniref:Uncharacterized protein n=1 Tax=Durusdinium trenchii TaxID=1381693 RepID=A0ABP0H769_9DINO